MTFGGNPLVVRRGDGWAFDFMCSEDDGANGDKDPKDRRELNAYIGAIDGRRYLSFEVDNGDPVHLDEATSAGLIEAVREMRRHAGWETQ